MSQQTPHTVTALKRWSSQDRNLPAPDTIRHIHIYDFDNTLFLTPLPNKRIWASSTIGQMQGIDFLQHGGWWHNPRILSATGEGMDIEESRAWSGFWNENIVDLVRLSMADSATLSVLLTGRKDDGYPEILQRMLKAKGLEFDILGLKPSVGPSGQSFHSTIDYKETFLTDLVLTYPSATELRIYEDRPKHTKSFRDFFADLNKHLLSTPSAGRNPIAAEVIQVSEQEINMIPESEIAVVQSMINSHNQAILDGSAKPGSTPYRIQRSVFSTGYNISPADTERLKSLVKPPARVSEGELHYFANSICIKPGMAGQAVMEKVGGIGAKVTWKVTGVGVVDQRVWAARLEPTNRYQQVVTENAVPCVPLATRRMAKTHEVSRIHNWQPVPDHNAFEFETVVGEKVLLRVEPETDGDGKKESKHRKSRRQRERAYEEEFPSLSASRSAVTKPYSRPAQRGNNGSRGGGPGRGGGGGGGNGGHRGGGNGHGGFRPRRGNGGRGGRGGGGGRGNYRSLDDNPSQGYGADSMQY